MTRFARVGRTIASTVIAALMAASPVAAYGVAAPAQPMPCPRADTPPVDAPRLSPPPESPGARVVGGDRLLSSGLVVMPGAATPPAVTATSWVVADLGTGAVLGACGAHEYGAPASVQKLLLAATLLAKLDPQQIVTITGDDLQFEPGSSALGLVEGGQYTVETLWLGLLLVSGNDAANVLARLGGGASGLEGGVAEMNAQAQRLGAFHTHAATPSGLDGPGQVTTAYDLALIARACFADEDFVRYALTRQAQVPAQPLMKREGFQIQNQNHLIDRYPGALGGKTGFTDLARHTYVGAAERDGRRLVVTLLGAEHAPTQGWEQGAALLDWGFAQPSTASVGRLVDPAELVPSPSVTSPPVLALPQPGDKTPSVIAFGAAAACVALAVAMTRRRGRRRQ
jgi:D-alanyl-D-alanine carboxypeptidase (penicillin-binding protein 5/6)